jgi:hypothetical protein
VPLLELLEKAWGISPDDVLSDARTIADQDQRLRLLQIKDDLGQVVATRSGAGRECLEEKISATPADYWAYHAEGS